MTQDRREDGFVLVTGGARRIGRAIAERLARDGAAVVIHSSARTLPEAEALAAEIRGGGGRAATIAADLADESEVRGLISGAARAFGWSWLPTISNWGRQRGLWMRSSSLCPQILLTRMPSTCVV